MSDLTQKDNDPEPEDHPGTAFDPRHLLTISIILGFLARWIIQLPFLPRIVAIILGPISVVAAFALFFWAGSTMSKSNTPVPVNEPTSAIVDDGPFRFSRNPTYVAVVLLQIGLAIWSNSLWFVGIALLSAVLLHQGVIIREERYLEEKFGADYLAYKDRVRRWL